MPVAGWFNENLFRDFPFQLRTSPHDGTQLPLETIVDFGAIMGINSGYVEDQHAVYLYRIQRSGDVLTFEFHTTSPDADDEALLFTRAVTAEPYEHEYAESIPLTDIGTSASSASSESPCSLVGKWSGFLVTGRFVELLLLLPGDGELTFDDDLWLIEPSRMQSLLHGFVRSINLANYDRVHATGAIGCDPAASESSDVPVPTYVNSRCMQGDLLVKPGYNCVVRQEDSSNSIIISAAKGSGEGEPCEEVPLFDGELPPEGSRFLSGGTACDETVRSVLGKGGRDLRLLVGAGLRVSTDADQPNTLRLEVALDDFNLCINE